MLAWIFGERRRRNLLVLVVGMVAAVVVSVVVGTRVADTKQSWNSFQERGGVAGGLGMPTEGGFTQDADHDHIERPDGREVAVEVVRAWLADDDATLAELGNANVVTLLADRQAPAGLTVETATLNTDGDTYQSWTVALSDGSNADVSLSWAALGESRWTVTTVILGA